MLAIVKSGKDYYQTLGLSKDASPADIKKAYRDLSKKWHPDKHKGDKDAESRFKEINEAYETVGDPDKRRRYDQFGSAGGPGGGAGGGFGGFDFSGFQQGDFGGAEGLGDIFNAFFGGGARGGGRARERGRDLHIAVTIDFAESVSGVTKTVAVERMIACAACGGKGAEKGSAMKKCEKCGGTGQVTHTAQSIFGTIRQSVMCDTCEGAGSIPERRCKECGGDGRKRERSTLNLDIPAGIADGQTLRVTGQGEAGPRGSATGDLYVEIGVRLDPRFVRDGDDIRGDLRITVPDAVLGVEAKVETVHGGVTLKIPAGTQSGEVLRIKGKGMPGLRSGRLGDHYVRVVVEIPKKLSREEKKLVEDWKKLER